VRGKNMRRENFENRVEENKNPIAPYAKKYL